MLIINLHVYIYTFTCPTFSSLWLNPFSSSILGAKIIAHRPKIEQNFAPSKSHSEGHFRPGNNLPSD